MTHDSGASGDPVGYEPGEGKKGGRRIKVDVDKPSVKVQARKGCYTES